MDEIEIRIIEEDKLPFRLPPLEQGNHKIWGEPSQAEVCVICGQKVILAVQKHAQSSSNEVGGILIGDAYRDQGTLYVQIEAYIPASTNSHHQSSTGYFNFTPETWAEMLRKKDAQFENFKVVGWFHSHPDHGVFLSKQDMRIQDGYFNHAWQIAMVYDPIKHHGGFFFWQAMRVVDAPGFIEFFEEGRTNSILSWKNLGVVIVSKPVLSPVVGSLIPAKSQILWPVYVLLGILFLFGLGQLFVFSQNFNYLKAIQSQASDQNQRRFGNYQETIQSLDKLQKEQKAALKTLKFDNQLQATQLYNTIIPLIPPTSTPTKTLIPTKTPQPTSTPIPTKTLQPTPTPTPVLSDTPGPSSTPTATVSPTKTPTVTRTSPPTKSPTPTKTATSTVTVTQTATATSTATSTSTEIPVTTNSVTPTP